jgi:hypothetical protein
MLQQVQDLYGKTGEDKISGGELDFGKWIKRFGTEPTKQAKCELTKTCLCELPGQR